jgi:hypothetical protein
MKKKSYFQNLDNFYYFFFIKKILLLEKIVSHVLKKIPELSLFPSSVNLFPNGDPNKII